MTAFVVAASDNGVIGRDNQLPWHLPADLKRFRHQHGVVDSDTPLETQREIVVEIKDLSAAAEFHPSPFGDDLFVAPHLASKHGGSSLKPPQSRSADYSRLTPQSAASLCHQ